MTERTVGGIQAPDMTTSAGSFYVAFRRCLVGLALLAAVGLANAIWVSQYFYASLYVVLLLIGAGGSLVVSGYINGYAEAGEILGWETRIAVRSAVKEAELAAREKAAATEDARRIADEAARAADEAARSAELAAQQPCAIRLDDSRQRPGEGFLYIIRFSSGAIKVGQTVHLRQRIAKHRRDAAALDVAITGYWVSPPHRNYLANEKVLIARCARIARRAKNEYFHGTDLDTVQKFASSLTYLSGATDTPEAQR